MSITRPHFPVGSRVLLRETNRHGETIHLPGTVRLASSVGFTDWLYHVEPDLTPGCWANAMQDDLQAFPAQVIEFPLHHASAIQPAARASGSLPGARSPAAPSPDRACCLPPIGQPGEPRDPGDGPRVA